MSKHVPGSKSYETLGYKLPGLANYKIFHFCGCFLTSSLVINGAQNVLSPEPDTNTLSDFLPQTNMEKKY